MDSSVMQIEISSKAIPPRAAQVTPSDAKSGTHIFTATADSLEMLQYPRL
jgi:hypothetical protein